MSDAVAEALAAAIERERSGDAGGALDIFDAAIRDLEPSVLLYSNRGLLLERMQRIEEALGSFLEAARVEPNFRDYYNAGNMLLHLQRYEEAIEQFQLSIEQRDDYPECWVNLGIVQHSLKQWDDARVAFGKVLEADDSFYPALRSLAILESSQGDESTASEYYERAVRARPDDVNAWFELGCSLYKTLGEGQVFFEPDGPEGKTIQAFDKVIELDASKQGAWGRKIGVLFRLVDAAQAVDTAAAGAGTGAPRMFPLIHGELMEAVQAACIRFPDDAWFADRKADAQAMGTGSA